MSHFADNDLPVRSQWSYADEAGAVYMTRNQVLRAVPPKAAERMRALLRSGLPDALANAALMPATRISDMQLSGASLVTEHPRLPVVTCPYEWSHGMLRAAAVCVLEVNEMANRFGYELADCHGFNVVFDGIRPLYVDLGSLVQRSAGSRGWQALEEFVRFYEYPLRIWGDGSGFIARRLVAASELMGHSDYGAYRWPWLRGSLAARYGRWRTNWFKYRRLSSGESGAYPVRAAAIRVLCKLVERGWLPFQSTNLAQMRMRIRRCRRTGGDGFWSTYQSGNSAFAETPRFRRLTELVASAKLESVLELAGNQGMFSERLLAVRATRRVICTDADEAAVDRGFHRATGADAGVNFAVLDFIHPMMTPFGDSPVERLRSDGVIALAVAHHVLLSQRVPVERMLKAVGSFSRRMVFIEFMPLGLWDGEKAPPIPDWYRLEWFREAFAREFILEHEERLETNRHLFCGRVRRIAT